MKRVADVAIMFTAAGAVTFVIGYAWSTRGAWSRSAMGRHVMTFMAVIMVASGLALAGVLFGTDWPARDAIRAVAWTAIGACIWWQVGLLRRVQREHRDEPGDDHGQS